MLLACAMIAAVSTRSSQIATLCWQRRHIQDSMLCQALANIVWLCEVMALSQLPHLVGVWVIARAAIPSLFRRSYYWAAHVHILHRRRSVGLVDWLHATFCRKLWLTFVDV